MGVIAMSISRSILESGSRFVEILGHWFAVWILDVVFGLVAGFLDVFNVVNIPQIVWITSLAIGFFLAPAYAFHRMRIFRDELDEKLHNRTAVIAILNQLAELRASGVSLRNTGMDPLTGAELDDWHTAVDKWHVDLRKKANELAEFEKGLLATLNWVSPLYVSTPSGGKQKKTLNELNETLERLGRLLEAYRPIIWS
jgi:hypothetical protein